MKEDYYFWNVKKIDINSKVNKLFFHEREILFSHTGLNVGSEQNGKGKSFGRPVIILCKFSKEIFWGIPLTTKNKVGSYYVSVNLGDSVDRTAIIPQLRVMDARRLYQKIGIINKETYENIINRILELLSHRKHL